MSKAWASLTSWTGWASGMVLEPIWKLAGNWPWPGVTLMNSLTNSSRIWSVRGVGSGRTFLGSWAWAAARRMAHTTAAHNAAARNKVLVITTGPPRWVVMPTRHRSEYE